MTEAKNLIESARRWQRGHAFSDMRLGQVFEHHWGRTLTEADSISFSTMTMHFNPLYFNVEYAKAHQHPNLVVNPMLVFLTVFGMSVEDLSESGGAFLGVEKLSFKQPVYPGETLTSRSEVINLRESNSRPDFGIATWHTEGFNQVGDCVIGFDRTNMIAKRLRGN